MWYKSITRVFLLTLAMAVCASAQFGPRDRSSSSTSDGPGSGRTVIRFMPSWTNTSAVMIINGQETIMTAVKNYCGWFEARTQKPAGNFFIRFKQTIGNTYVGAEGNEEVATGALPMFNEILLDSVAALSDTLWIQSFKNGAPEVFAEYPGILGPCPTRTISVMMFDWLHGNLGDGEFDRIDGQKIWLGGHNAAKNDSLDDVTYLISNDFGSGGCQSTGGKAMLGMVEPILGANGVPKRNSSNFPADCHGTDWLDYWFLPLEIAEDASGKKYTNSTCRNLDLELDKEGYWFGQKNSQSPERGLFFLDDFQYLDEAQTVPNIFYDRLNGSGGYHNFGFTMKFQAKFEYVRGQKFEFKGDDDVWVFINNRLVVDIGGQHAEVSGAVDLDTLGLVEGQEYPFHIFYVERHTSSSNFMMRTSMDLHTDASIFLTSDSLNAIATGQPWSPKNYTVWQITKGDALSCDFDANEGGMIDTTEGPSNYRLTGNNLGEAGVMLDATNKWWYEGIMIEDSWTRFTIDTARIVENNGLAPGHYYLEITLKSDPSQKTGVWFTIPPYKVPTLVFATERWQSLGPQVSGDTLQIGKWAYEKYKVQVMFLEDWAQVSIYNQNVSLTSSDPKMQIVDENGKPIGKVTLDSSGRASFYVIANAPVSGVTLQAKGTASSASSWIKLVFQEPPIPRISSAEIYDRNGDGRGDSLHITWDKAFDSQNILTSLQVNFGEDHPEQQVKPFTGKTLELTSGTCHKDKACGFGSLVFTGANSGVFTGYMTTHITYKEGGRDYHFTIRNEPVSDGVNPIIKSAVKSIADGTNHILTITFSEAITDSVKKYYADMFQYTCIRADAPADPIKPNSQTAEDANKMSIIFVGSSVSQVIPSVGDLIRFTPGSGATAQDLSLNRPHKDNPWVSITGEQEMTISSAGLVSLDPSNPIVRSDSSTVPKLVTEENKSVEQVAGDFGVQGHLVSFDVGTLISDQTKEDVAELDNFINQLMNSGTFDTTITKMSVAEATQQLIEDIKNDRLGGAYGISDTVLNAIKEGLITAQNLTSSPLLTNEDKQAFNELVNTSIANSIDTVITSSLAKYATAEAVFEAIKNGTIPTSDLEEFGVSQRVIDAIKSEKLTAANLDAFRSGDSTLISPSQVHLSYKTHYYSHLGHYVGGQSGMIGCEDPVYKEDDPDANCITNSGKIFLAWNMRSNKGALVATGVYIARLEFKITIDEEVIKHTTRDFLWGVRRGKKNGITLDPTK